MRRAAVALIWVVGCATANKRLRDPLAESLAAGDAAWEQRGTTGNVDAAERSYTALLATWWEEGRVLWRLSRVEWSRALLDGSMSQTWHEAGREYAMRCLMADAAFAESVYRIGDRIPAAALENLPVEAAPCLVFAAAHTVALVRGRGPGSALDYEDVPPLLDAAARLDPSAEPALAAWARGNVELSDGAVLDARAHFRTAVESAAGQRFFRAEAIAAFPDLSGAWPEFAADPTWALENAAVVNATGQPPR